MTRTLLTVLAFVLPTTALGADRYAGTIDEDYLGTTAGGTAAYEVLPLDHDGEVAAGGGALALELSTPVKAPRGFSSADGWEATAALVASTAVELDLTTLAALQSEAYAAGEPIDLDAALSEAGDAIGAVEASVGASWVAAADHDAVPGVVDLLVLPPVDLLQSGTPTPDREWLGAFLEAYPADLAATHLVEADETTVVVMASDSSELMLVIVAAAEQVTWVADGSDDESVVKAFSVEIDNQDIDCASFEGGSAQAERASSSVSSDCRDPRGCR
jgi:hypothetical protein